MTTKKAVALYVVCRGLPIHGTLSITSAGQLLEFPPHHLQYQVSNQQKKKKNIP